jgi:type IV pilus assembly protein PilC
MRFNYSAKSKDGSKVIKGEIEAPNEKSALDLLRSKSLIVFALVPISGNQISIPGLNNIRGVSLGTKVQFTTQLASMVSAGLALTKALDILQNQVSDKRMRAVVSELLDDVEGGNSLADGMNRHPKIFSEEYISLVRAGESSGKLDQVLTRLSESMEKRRQFQAKVKGALIYPLIILIVMGVVFGLILVLVIPKLTVLYDSLNVELPITTKIFIALSDFLIHKWWLLLIIIFLVGFFYRMFKNTETGKYFLARLTFNLPVFGPISKQSGLVEFTNALGLLIQSGVPIVDCLKIVRNSSSNILYQDSIGRFLEDVKHGYPLSQSVAREEYFPPIVSSMLTVGEETGTMDKSLTNLSMYFEGEVDRAVKNLSTAMEPFIMVMLGILVTVLILSVITPIYKLTTSF